MCNIKPLIACSLLVTLALHPWSALPRWVLLFICLLGPKTWPEENQSYVRFGNRCSAGGCGFFSFFFFFFFFVLSSELRSTPQKIINHFNRSAKRHKNRENSGLYVISRVGIFREGPALALATSVSGRHHRLTPRQVSRSARRRRVRSPGRLSSKLVVQWVRGRWRELWSAKCSWKFREPCLRQFPLPLPEKLRPQVMAAGREAVDRG